MIAAMIIKHPLKEHRRTAKDGITEEIAHSHTVVSFHFVYVHKSFSCESCGPRKLPKNGIVGVNGIVSGVGEIRYRYGISFIREQLRQDCDGFVILVPQAFCAAPVHLLRGIFVAAKQSRCTEIRMGAMRDRLPGQASGQQRFSRFC